MKLVAQTGEGDQEKEAVMLNWVPRDADFAEDWITTTSMSGLLLFFNKRTAQRSFGVSSREILG